MTRFQQTAAIPRAPGTEGVPLELHAGDFNGDGFLDLLVASFMFPIEDRGVPIQIFLGNASGTIVEATSTVFVDPVPATVHPREIITADFNGDGTTDIFIADHGYDSGPFPGARNVLLLSDGSGRLRDASSSLPTVADFTHSAAAADIDGDGDIDIYVGNIWGQQLVGPYVMFNDGQGGFSASSDRIPAAYTSLAARSTTSLFLDVDRDGDQDLLLGGDQGSSRILVNDGNGSFSLGAETAIPHGPFGAGQIVVDSHAADLNGDGSKDVILVSTGNSPFYFGNAIQILISRGDGTFADETASRMPVQPGGDHWITYVHLVDFNYDGHVDLMTEPNFPGTAQVFINDGTGVFTLSDVDTASFPIGMGRYEPIDIRNDGIREYVWFDGQFRIFTDTIVPNVTLIEGTENADTRTGGPANDTIRGFGGNDILSGGPGNDVLEGGAGDDLLDGGVGSDSALFAGARDGFALRSFASGDGRIFTQVRDLSGAEGTDTLVAIETLAFAGRAFGLSGIQQNATANLDGGAFNDIVFQNATTGAVHYIDTGPGGGAFATQIAALPASWVAQASGDFSGDGVAEVVIEAPDGKIYSYQQGGTWSELANLTSAWNVTGVGDFTGDGTLDIAVQNSGDGVNYFRDLDGGGSWGVLPNVGFVWRIVGFGDTDRDGVSDMVIQEIATGLTYYANMDAGGVHAGWGFVAGGLGTGWVAKGVGDLNGDGFDDVVFRNSATGQIWAVDMLGGAQNGWMVATNGVGANWDVFDVIDHDNDGYDDVVIREVTTGHTLAVDVDAGAFAGLDALTGAMGSDWALV